MSVELNLPNLVVNKIVHNKFVIPLVRFQNIGVKNHCPDTTFFE